MIGFAIGAATMSAGAIIFAGLLLSVYLNQPGPGIISIIGAAIMITLVIRLLPEYRRDQDRKDAVAVRLAAAEREQFQMTVGQ